MKLNFVVFALPLALAACATQPQPRAPIAPAAPLEVQILAINDFHGNLETPERPISVQLADGSKLEQRLGGAAALAATIGKLEAGEPHSITVAAGDLIGASPLVSAYFLDEPTIHALNAIGLDIAAVGNHEFDKGSAELRRIQTGGCDKFTSRQPCAIEPYYGARFQYLAANVLKSNGTTIFPATAIRQFGPVTIGFIGMTLKETETLVTPAGVAGLTFTEEAATANALVPGLRAAGADAIVLLIHQGGKAPVNYRVSGCEGLSGPILDIAGKLDPAITTIVSGHSHYAYACEMELGGAQRLLTSAGRYGYLVTDISMRFHPASQQLVGQEAVNVPVTGAMGADAEVAALVERYATAAEPAAARVVGRLQGPAPFSETRGESPASNLIADAALAATRAPDRGNADLAFVNASGVRTGLIPAADGSITYGQIFAMQPFGNNLVVKTLTGAQLKTLLEQQFVSDGGAARVGSLLAPSANFTFSYDLSRPEGQRIVSMELNGEPIDPAARYRVTVNNFLASGGDGFSVLTEGTDTFDAGLDLDALEAWLASNPEVPEVGRTVDVTPS